MEIQIQRMDLWTQWEKERTDEWGKQHQHIYSITNSMDINLGKLLEMVRDREAGHAMVHGLQRAGQNLVTE